jgi:hypothetical protein
MGNHLKTVSRPESDCNAFFSQQKGPLQRGKVSQILTAATGQHPPYPPPTARSYTEAGLPWFDYYRDDVEALPGRLRLVI